MESKRLSKLSYALSYEKDMINHIIKQCLYIHVNLELQKNRNMKLNLK